MTAPAPSAAEQAVIDRFGIFDEERVVEEVARAIYDANGSDNPWLYSWANADERERSSAYRLATAAVTAYRATQDGDLRNRMADVADNLDYYSSKTDGGTYAGGLSDAAGHIRDALAGVQDGGAEAAVRRVEALAEEYERRGRINADPTSLDSRVHQMAADRIRAALAPQADR